MRNKLILLLVLYSELARAQGKTPRQTNNRNVYAEMAERSVDDAIHQTILALSSTGYGNDLLKQFLETGGDNC